jgi:multidrug efflux pump subunit AcrA (membrane-fusion protein)
MKRILILSRSKRRFLGMVPSLLLLAVMAGCHKATQEKKPIEVEPPVRVVKPEKRTLRREVGQPGYVFAYEQTSMYPKVAGYIDEWKVDIGDRIKKGQLLAHIYVPELHARHREKKAQVELGEVRVQLAERDVEVAQEQVQVALADIDKYKMSSAGSRKPSAWPT